MSEMQSLVNLSDDDLFEQLGREIWSQTSHAAPATSKSLRSFGREWLKKNLPEAKDAVCGNSVVEAIRGKADEITLIGAIADIFAKSLGFPVPSIVAILVVRIGLDRLCSNWVSSES